MCVFFPFSKDGICFGGYETLLEWREMVQVEMGCGWVFGGFQGLGVFGGEILRCFLKSTSTRFQKKAWYMMHICLQGPNSHFKYLKYVKISKLHGEISLNIRFTHTNGLWTDIYPWTSFVWTVANTNFHISFNAIGIECYLNVFEQRMSTTG